MVIADLPYLSKISNLKDVTGGTNISYDNRAVAIANSYADGLESFVATGSSVYLDRGYSQSLSFSEAKSSS